ncbi:MAG: fumarylacetoacetate hydrolase family protein [Burkholderiales bacterium]
MSREEAQKTLVDALLRKRGLPTITEGTRRLIEAFRKRKPAQTADLPLSTEKEAYRIQEEVFAALWPGARATAWKAGGPSDKVEPTAAPIAAESVLRSPASVAGATMQMIGVEAEVAFRLAKDLPPRGRPYSASSIAAAVGEVVVAIELCDTRLANWKETSGLWKLADFQNNSALVVGSGIKDWQKIDFPKQEMEFRIGTRVSKAKGAHSFGNPFRLLPWLVKHCAKRGLGLHAGDVVTTGAWTGLEIAQPGDEVVARFAGIGEARVKIA